MKKLILIITCAGLMATTMFAQNGNVGISTAPATTSSTTTAKSTKTAKYICPKCKTSSDKPGACAKCHATLVKEGMYYCPGCGATSEKAGKCAHCNMDLVKMTASTSPQ